MPKGGHRCTVGAGCWGAGFGAAGWLTALAMLLVCGCQSSSQGFHLWNPFNLKLLGGQTEVPVRVGIAFEQKSALDPRRWIEELRAEPWSRLAKNLSHELKRPVQVEPLTVDQIAYHLQSGRLQFALVPGESLQRITEHQCEFIPLAAAQIAQRRGVIVADADSGIRTFGELKGKRFAFGPKGDAIADIAAKAALQANGVAVEDLRKEILPIPGTLQYHISSFEVAKEVVYGGTPAGVLDADEFETMSASGGRFSWRGFRLSRDQFNVIGYTEPIAEDTLIDARFLASPSVNERTRDAVRAMLVGLKDHDAKALRDLGFARFDAAP